MVGGLAALLLVTSGCYGPFNLTRRLHHWNGGVSNDKWAKEAVFLVCAWLPVYGIATLADAVLFNSLEFWTGDNPIKPVGMAGALSQRGSARIAQGDAEAIVTRAVDQDGSHLIIEQFQQGRPAAALHVQERDGVTVGMDAEGKVVLRAQTLPDGSIVIGDADGKPVAAYSNRQVRRLARTAAAQ